MTNAEIRFAARSAQVPIWRLADHFHVAEQTLYRRLRKELPEEQKALYLKAIDELSNKQH